MLIVDDDDDDDVAALPIAIVVILFHLMCSCCSSILLTGVIYLYYPLSLLLGFHSGCYRLDTLFQRCIELKNGCIFDFSIHISHVCQYKYQKLPPRKLTWQLEIHHEWRLNNRGFIPASHVRFFSQKFTHFFVRNQQQVDQRSLRWTLYHRWSLARLAKM